MAADRRRTVKRSDKTGRSNGRPTARVEVMADGSAVLHYDATEEPDGLTPEVLPPDAPPPPPEPDPEAFEPGTFGARVAAKRRDLVLMLKEGVKPIQHLPASEGMLVRGKRHHLAAPRKTGKSITMEAHYCDMIESGARGIIVLDRENGSEEYARRLAGVFKHKGYTPEEIERIRARLHYFEFPQLKQEDGPEFAEWARGLEADLVVFDSQRMFLTDLGLKEDAADDYSTFMNHVVDPLFRAGITTLVLDNTGHRDKDRARGSVAKGDLNEVLLVLETEVDFDLGKKGRVRMYVADSRFGTRGEWRMEIGGGTFGSWEAPGEAADNAEFRRAAIEAVKKAGGPLGADKIIEAAREQGVKIKQKHARSLLTGYADGARGPLKRSDEGKGGYVLR